MSFTSIAFFLFFLVFFIIYWLLGKKSHKAQNILIVFASCLFYCLWDYRCFSLILFTTLTSYVSGLLLEKHQDDMRKCRLISISNIFVNISILAFFKYCNFFIDSFVDLLRIFNASVDDITLNIILPIGISFYTFKAIGYSIDVYRHKTPATRNLIAFTAYITFFLEIAAGPIDRSTNLLQQLQKERTFSYATGVDGMKQILWGLFKKIVVANNCALYVNTVFSNPSNFSGSTLALAGIFYTIQIYGDFSGYSDIAIGSGKLLGFNLAKNFQFPYFARNIAEFWRRWHISLTSWFRDYIYIPLGGSRCSKWKIIRNTFIVYLVSGLWHGANWTFLFWGLYHACLFLPLILTGRNKKYKDTVASGSKLPTGKEILQMLLTFTLVTIGWIIFRADSIGQAGSILLKIFTSKPAPILINSEYIQFILLSIIMFIVEWFQREHEHGLSHIKLPHWLQFTIYLAIFMCVYAFWGNEQIFIYSQF